MSDVEFQDSSYAAPRASRKTGGISQLVIKLGLAKNNDEAQKVLLVVLIVVLLATAFVWLTMPKAAPETPSSAPVSVAASLSYA